MKSKLYLESTIPSYLVARPSRDVKQSARQKWSHDWWRTRRNDFEIFVSGVVVQEIAEGEPAMAANRLKLIQPFARLEAVESARLLATALVRGGPLPVKAERDAAHIALAAVHGMHFLLTWNCTHIANAEMFPKMWKICEAHGFACPVICTPEELLAQ